MFMTPSNQESSFCILDLWANHLVQVLVCPICFFSPYFELTIPEEILMSVKIILYVDIWI